MNPESIHQWEENWNALTDQERHQVKRLLLRHTHIPNANDAAEEKLTPGERVADKVAATMGSWRFIIIQSIVLSFWIVLNALAWIHHWDPYPFILLNLALSFQAAYSAPIIMMSQNRQASKDRLSAEIDYRINLHAEAEVAGIRIVMDDLVGNQWVTLMEMQAEQLRLLTEIESLTTEVRNLRQS